MAQCIDCEKQKTCDYLKHPSNRHLTPESYHNCQDFVDSTELDGKAYDKLAKRCGYKWTPRKVPSEIKECPNCHSRKWNKSRN